MKNKLLRRLRPYKRSLWCLGAIAALSLGWALTNHACGIVTTVNSSDFFSLSYNTPPPNFIGSPPRMSPPEHQRTHLDLNQNGWFLEKLFKQYRTTSWFELGPGLGFLNFPIHLLTGWDAYDKDDSRPVLPCQSGDNSHLIKNNSCHCLIGRVSDLRISEGDGDINFYISLSPEFQYLAKLKRHYLWAIDPIITDPDLNNWPKLLCEIDEPLRVNFPALADLRNDDCVRTCGQSVLDRAHPHNELHPITYFEIVTCPNYSRANLNP